MRRAPNHEQASSSIEYLTSPAAASSLAKDPYWSKRDAPWWHVLALKEAGVEPRARR
jgi:hypothetical protein